MANVFKFIIGQTSEGLNFILKDKITGNAVSVVGATITLTAFTVKGRVKLFSGACQIDDGANGLFSYSFIVADLDTTGSYEGQVKIVFADTSIGLVQDFYLKVEEVAPV